MRESVDPMSETLCELRSIVKDFDGVRALDGVCFALQAGEVHALLGENGAGKSTLMKILSGAYQPASGEIIVAGSHVTLKSPHHARQLGISIVHQEPQMVNTMSIAENVCLGAWPAKGGVVDLRKMRANSAELCVQIGLNRPVVTPVGELSVAEKQMVQIARALMVTSKILILDEPTSSLTPQEKNALFRIIRRLQEQGMGIVYISHRLEEVFEIADRATVLKDGRLIDTKSVSSVDSLSLVRMMVGRQIGKLYPPKGTEFGPDILVVEGLERNGAFHGINFTLRRGEVLGVAGLVGAGRSDVALSLFGVTPAEKGKIILKNRESWFRTTKEAIKGGIALVGEDRHAGLVHDLSVRENVALPSLGTLARGGIIKRALQVQKVRALATRLRIKTPSVEQRVRALSGGNQQKVIFARWLLKDADVFILDEPTRGIDVGAKEEIYQLVRNLAKDGKGVILISSELPEILGMSDRILVMHQGTVVGIFDGNSSTEESIGQHILGVS